MHPAWLSGCRVSLGSFVQSCLNIIFRILVWQREKFLLPDYNCVAAIREQSLA